MTIGELKQLLTTVKDDVPLMVQDWADDYAEDVPARAIVLDDCVVITCDWKEKDRNEGRVSKKI